MRFGIFMAIFGIYTSIYAQKPRFTPQAHEIGIQLLGANYFSKVADYQKDNTPFNLNFGNGIIYKYHLSLTDAVRIGVGWRNAAYEINEGIDRFASYQADKQDLDISLGYERKLNLGPVQLFGGFLGILGRGNVEDMGALSATGDSYTGKYFYSNYGGALFGGLRLFFSKNISLALEGQGYYLQTRRQAAPENTFYLFPENELGYNANVYLSFHLVKMKKRCVCPARR